MTKFDHITEAQQFRKEWIVEEFIPLAKRMKTLSKEKARKILKGKEMVSFFYEPSSRTRMSFELGFHRLGGTVVFRTENGKEFSSAAKGETVEDTSRVISGYKPDVVVMRTHESGMIKRAVKYSSAPIISAGDGQDQHPTQALLDVYTIWEEKGRLSDLSIVFSGDLKRGRTVRSLIYLSAKFPGIKFYLVSPKPLQLETDIKDYLNRHKVLFEEYFDLRQVAPEADVLYATREQTERSEIPINPDDPPYFCTVNQEVLDLMKKDAIIMHPFPRKGEIAPEVDKDPRAAYFRQVENGLPVRMALFQFIKYRAF